MKILFITLSILLVFVHFLELYYKKRTLKIPIQDLAEDVIHWCQIMYPVRKKSPNIIINNKKSKLAGEYCYFSNTIIIYKINVSHNSVINTLIHEYFHYYLITSDNKNNLYQKQLELYGYENHPQEIIC